MISTYDSKVVHSDAINKYGEIYSYLDIFEMKIQSPKITCLHVGMC